MADAINTNPNMILPTNKVNRMWAKGDLFVPGGGAGLYVPNVNDAAYEFTSDMFILYHVVDANFTTGKSDLAVRYALPRSDIESGRDIILSAAPGKPSDAFRAYVNSKVKPSTINIDNFLYFVGTQATSIRIFRGTDIGNSGEVVSAMYDQGGRPIGENIPLEEVATWKLPNVGGEQGKTTSVKVAVTGYLVTEVDDNELLTVVAYGADNSIIRIEQVVAVNSGFIRQVDAWRRYVVEVGIDSPYLSEGDQNLIVFPYNLPVDSVFANCVVTYSDGSKRAVAIDGTQARLYGLNERRVSLQRADLKLDLQLTYLPSAEEFYYGETIGQFRHISRRYKAVTTAAEAPYSFKIFAFPSWTGALTGYRMRYFMTTLARDKVYEVTDHIRLGINSPAFEPALYGQAQHLILTLDLGLVDNYYPKGTRVTQPIIVVLRDEGTSAGEVWSVSNDPEDAAFGLGLKALGDYIQNDRTDLNIRQGAASLSDWLNRVFYAVGPLRNPSVESVAPAPTHFNMVVGSYRAEYPVSAYVNALQIPFLPDPGTLVCFEWIDRTGNGDLFLGASAIPFYQMD